VRQIAKEILRNRQAPEAADKIATNKTLPTQAAIARARLPASATVFWREDPEISPAANRPAAPMAAAEIGAR
jgi:hypothetical protein